MRYLKQSTAFVIEVGPFVDDTDGKTLEEALTVASIDVQLMQPLDTAAVPPDLVTNGTFAADSDWTKNSWTISAGVANSAAAQDTNLDQTISITENKAYEITFEVKTRSAGSVTPIIGGTSGTARSTAAIFTETIIAGPGSLIRFDAIGFTGTIDDVVIKQVPIPITPAASGSANDMVLTQSNTGTYWLELTAAQLGIVGRHKLTAFISGALIVWEEFTVLSGNVYDALFGASAALGTDIAKITTDVAAILVDSNELQTDNVPGLIAALNDLSAAQVNTEVVDVLFTDTLSELTAAIPAATPSIAAGIMLMYMALRNKLDITDTLMEIHNDAGAVIAKAALSDDGTTYTEAKTAAGP